MKVLTHSWMEADGFTSGSFFGGQTPPRSSGVYVFACFRHIWYVGCSVDLCARLRYHNLRGVIPDLCSVWWKHCSDYERAEKTLISELDPILNIRFGRGAMYRSQVDLVRAFPESFIGGFERRRVGA